MSVQNAQLTGLWEDLLVKTKEREERDSEWAGYSYTGLYELAEDVLKDTRKQRTLTQVMRGQITSPIKDPTPAYTWLVSMGLVTKNQLDDKPTITHKARLVLKVIPIILDLRGKVCTTYRIV